MIEDYKIKFVSNIEFKDLITKLLKEDCYKNYNSTTEPVRMRQPDNCKRCVLHNNIMYVEQQIINKGS